MLILSENIKIMDSLLAALSIFVVSCEGENLGMR